MATSKQTKQFQDLIAKMTPELRAAFLQSVQGLHDRVNWKALLAALDSYNIEEAIEVLGLTKAAFYGVSVGLTSAYAQGGALVVAGITGPNGGAVKFLFDMTNPVAEAWVKQHGAEKVTGRLTKDTIDAVRETVVNGYAKGQHPFTIARAIAGKVVNGKRTGGVLGLSAPQARYLNSMRERLASGSASEIKKILANMTLRDRRFDSLLKKVIAGEAKLTAKNIEDMTSSYNNKLLKRRAEDVSRTETATAVMTSRKDGWQQTLAKLGYPDKAVTKTWRYGGGAKEQRPHHVAANNMRVVGLNTPFVLSNDAVLQHSHDADAPAEEVINCTCDTLFRLDHSWGLT